MSISLVFTQGPNYLIAKITGEWKILDISKAIDDIKAEADKRHLDLILLDAMELSSPKDEMIRFATGEKIAATFTFPRKLAGFAPHEKINRFAETVAINRYANFRIFPSEADAREWLLA